MNVDLDSYGTSKKLILSWLVDRDLSDVSNVISICSNFTYVPCIACAFFVGEFMGWPDSVLVTIQRLKNFYGYSEIKGIPASCPYKIL